ncbi:MAG: CCDC90 family protein [Magnetococcus sp. THC-1_WYH]
MATSTIAFDTLRFVRRLRDAGVEEKQAEAFSEALREVQDSQLKELATKGDIAALKSEMRELEYRLTIKLGGLMIAGFGVLAAIIKMH